MNPQSCIVVAESTIKEMSALMPPDEDNYFNQVLEKVEIYKKAEMTPVIILDPIEQMFYVITKETFGKKLH
jgi:hypothetical protein